MINARANKTMPSIYQPEHSQETWPFQGTSCSSKASPSTTHQLFLYKHSIKKINLDLKYSSSIFAYFWLVHFWL